MQNETALFAALITAGASFLGATLAQLLSHFFSLRREKAARATAARNYQLHLTFDMVSIVSGLESLLREIKLLSGPGNFRAPGPDPLPLKKADDSYTRLNFNLDVNPQFMLNVRGFFSQTKVMENYVRNRKLGKLEDYEVLLVIQLYLQGLSYVVASIRQLNSNKRTHISEPTYKEIVSVYHSDIGFTLPDEKIFEAAKNLAVQSKTALTAAIVAKSETPSSE